MKIHKCDQCGRELHEMPIVLRGWSGNGGGITLPAYFHEYDFCSDKCFEVWAVKRLPGMVVERYPGGKK